jgi:hypothetical protein
MPPRKPTQSRQSERAERARAVQLSQLRWNTEKPSQPGWYWYRGLIDEADPLIVLVDEAGYFQWPDGAFEDVRQTDGQWAGPIALPSEV